VVSRTCDAVRSHNHEISSRDINITRTRKSNLFSPLGACSRCRDRSTFKRFHLYSFGLSYTKFDYSDLTITKPSTSNASFTATASVTVTNTGSVVGSETVQLYVEPLVAAPSASPSTGYLHPRQLLKGFAKAKDIQPGKSATVKITLDKNAVSYWDDVINKWVCDKGEYGIQVGSSSEDMRLKASLKIDETFEWLGL
jgi:beta-glucosidase